MQTTSQFLTDSVKNVVVLINGLCDDGMNETSVVKVDVSELTPPSRTVRLNKISGNVNYGVVILSWSDTPERPFLILESTIDYCFEHVSGLNNPEITGSGDILLTTVGFDTNSNYSLLLELIKQY